MNTAAALEMCEETPDDERPKRHWNFYGLCIGDDSIVGPQSRDFVGHIARNLFVVLCDLLGGGPMNESISEMIKRWRGVHGTGWTKDAHDRCATDAERQLERLWGLVVIWAEDAEGDASGQRSWQDTLRQCAEELLAILGGPNDAEGHDA